MHQLLGIGAVGVYYAEVVNIEGKVDVAGVVFPKAGGDGDGAIAVGVESAFKGLIGKNIA